MSKLRNRSGNEQFIDIEGYFNKKYVFDKNNHWRMPDKVFVADKWMVSSLQDKKKKLNEVKGQLNQFPLTEWSKHTNARDHSRFIKTYVRQVFHPELLTQVTNK